MAAEDVVYHPFVIVGWRLIVTYRCMVVRLFLPVEMACRRVDYPIQTTCKPLNFRASLPISPTPKGTLWAQMHLHSIGRSGGFWPGQKVEEWKLHSAQRVL